MSTLIYSKTYLAVPPGETLKEQIKDRGIDLQHLAEHLKMSSEQLNHLLDGNTSLSRKIAVQLESIFDISVDFWLCLEENYRKTLELIQDENPKKN